MDSEPQLPAFYKDAHVLITGATGFFGKVLIEKLLRCCPELSKLYLLIRCKKGKAPEERLKELFDDAVFQRLPEECPDFLDKIEVLAGDCSLPSLGLGPEHIKLIQEKITLIFHGAATVRFDENLKIACAINVGGVRELIKICHQIKNLKALVHVSTAYANCNQSYIEEKFYEPPSCTPRLEQITQVLTAEEIDRLTPDLLQTWPNTYAMTKAIGEHYIKHEEGRLPVCVFRPAIVSSTYKEPIPGWIDNIYGPTGMALGAALGVLKVSIADLDVEANLVPVDMSANAMLLVARDTHMAFSSGDKEIKIYNYDSSCDNPIKWKDYQRLLYDNGKEVPSSKAVWYYSLTLTKHYYIYWILSLILHYLPAYAIDGICLLIGKKRQMVKVYDKITKFTTALSYFSTRSYKFDNGNVRELVKKTSQQDQKEFYIDIKTLDWNQYFSDGVLGCRLHILKEQLDTLPQARIKWRRLYWIHNATKCIIFYALAHLSYILSKKVYSLIY